MFSPVKNVQKAQRQDGVRSICGLKTLTFFSFKVVVYLQIFIRWRIFVSLRVSWFLLRPCNLQNGAPIGWQQILMATGFSSGQHFVQSGMNLNMRFHKRGHRVKRKLLSSLLQGNHCMYYCAAMTTFKTHPWFHAHFCFIWTLVLKRRSVLGLSVEANMVVCLLPSLQTISLL